jgi:hypothetical protein
MMCADGTVVMNTIVNGGTPPYVYTYLTLNDSVVETTNNGNNSNIEIGGGYHRVRVVDSVGCTVETNVNGQTYSWINVVDTLPSMVLKYRIIKPRKNRSNGRIKVRPPRNNRPYTYLWGNGSTDRRIKNLKEGEYHVTVTDVNGCSKTDTIILENFVRSETHVDETLIGDSTATIIPTLGQNYPNPATNGYTIIEYLIPENSVSYIVLIKANTFQVLAFRLDDQESKLTVTYNGLGRGEYYYQLIVDGNRISTKRMILK